MFFNYYFVTKIFELYVESMIRIYVNQPKICLCAIKIWFENITC